MQRNTLLIIILVCAIFALLLLVAVFHVAPVLSLIMCLVLVAVTGFLATETWVTHSAQEFENRFWTGVAAVTASALAFAPDSPLSHVFEGHYRWIMVLCCTFLVHTYDRHLHRKRISKRPFGDRSTSMTFPTEAEASANEKMTLIRHRLNIVDHPLISSFFLNLFFLPFIIRAENDVLMALSDCSKDELNYLLPRVELSRVFYKIKDHRFVRTFSRTRLGEMLAVDRLSDLRVAGRAALLHALQILRLSAHPDAERWVRNIILNTKAQDLTKLKMLMDSKGDVYTMHKLIYVDLRNPNTRAEILQHIAREADIQAAHLKLQTRSSQALRQYAWIKILSDVDDTLTCSGGHYPAGIDTRYPRKAVYPGVLAFYRELDLGVVGPDEWEEGRAGNLAFLSARPHVYKDIMETVSYDKFRKLVQSGRMHTTPSLLAGTLESGGTFMFQGSMEPLAEQKFKNFMEYYKVYPEYRFIFVADNGQGDVRAGELMLQAVSEKIKRIYVHIVQPVQKTYCRHHSFSPESESSKKFCFFNTYIDAATDAYHNSLIKDRGLRRIAMEAVRDITTISNWDSDLQREERYRELNASLELVNVVIDRLHLEPVPLLEYPQAIDTHTAVLTPFGQGFIHDFRPNDGIYEIRMGTPTEPLASPTMFVTLKQLLKYLPPKRAKVPFRHSSSSSKAVRL